MVKFAAEWEHKLEYFPPTVVKQIRRRAKMGRFKASTAEGWCTLQLLKASDFNWRHWNKVVKSNSQWSKCCKFGSRELNLIW